jgi:hypothetical protein
MHFPASLTLRSQLLLRGPSKGQFYSSHSIVNLVVSLCANYGALDPGINKIMSGGNWFQLPTNPSARASGTEYYRLADYFNQ